jgi:hypothetical protein
MKYLIPVAAILIASLFVMSFGCVNDPIKRIKNNPENMDILMNNITNDDAFRTKMLEKLIKQGDRQKLADQLVKDEDITRIILAKIVDTPTGKNEVANRVGNRLELIKIALDKAFMLPDYRTGIIDILLTNNDMVETMKNSAALKEKICSETK